MSGKGGEVVREVYGLIRDLLDEYGVTGGTRLNYLYYALAVRRIVITHKKKVPYPVMRKMIEGVTAYYTTLYDLDKELVEEIAQVVEKHYEK